MYCLETITIGFHPCKIRSGHCNPQKRLVEEQWFQDDAAGHILCCSLLHIMVCSLAYQLQFSFLSHRLLRMAVLLIFVQFLLHPNKYFGTEGWLLICAFVSSYRYENLIGFIFNNEYRVKSFARIMFEPYMRIFVQQFTVIPGSFVLMFGADKIFILVFAIAKIFFSVLVNYEAALPKANTKSNYQESNNSHS